jgi:glycosyltransferase involved in cell wall biosynthesis
MRIAIDLRSLQSGSVSGVENYALNLTQALLKLDRQNQYILFYNSWRQAPLPGDFHYINAKLVKTSIPNKVLNILFKLGLVKLESLIGEFDALLMPNANQISVGHGKKIYLTVHDLSPVVSPELYDLKRRLWHWFVQGKQLAHKAEKIFAVSEYTKEDLVRLYGIATQKITVAYPGLDHSVFHGNIPIAEQRRVRNVYGLPGRFILFLNTLEPRKNLETLLRAMLLVREPLTLVVAGKTGWKYASTHSLLSKAVSQKKVMHIGYVREHDKPALIALAEALVYPSLYEGFGFQPLEAAALGVPVVASQVTSIPEVIRDAALLVNPYSEEQIAQAIEEVVTNSALREALIKKGKARAQEFTWQKTAEIVLGAIRDGSK